MLTDREKSILLNVLEGKTAEEISKVLFISKRTIEHVKQNLIHKHGCTNLYEVIGICFRKKWIE